VGITVAASRLGVTAFNDASPVELRPYGSQDNATSVINAAYRQVLGNDYVLESERLTNAESLLRNGSISVREFVRALANLSFISKSSFITTSRPVSLNSITSIY